MAIALIAWLTAPAPMAWSSARPCSRMRPATAPATAVGLDWAATLRTFTGMDCRRAQRARGFLLTCCCRALLGELHRPGLSEHHHFDLPRVAQVLLNLLNDIAGETCRREVVNFVRLDDDANLPTCLDGKRAVHSREGVGDVLERFQPLGVRLQVLAASARPSGGDGIRGGHDRRFHGFRLLLAVMGLDGMDHVLGLTQALGNLAADDGVRALDFM